MPNHSKSILGIHQSGHITSAALVSEGSIIAGQAEERFTRLKTDKSFPTHAIDFCLDYANQDWNSISHVAVGWNPGENVAIKYRGGFSDWMRYPGEWLSSVPNHILTHAKWLPSTTITKFDLSGTGHNESNSPEIHFVDHHTAHARFASASASFSESAIVVVDGWGEQKTTSIFDHQNGALRLVEAEVFPNSIGAFYAAVTEFLGYRAFLDEWRVMGMAAYGNKQSFPEMDGLINLIENGSYEVDLKYFDFYNFDRSTHVSQHFNKLFGPSRKGNEPLHQHHFDFAAAAQRVFEKTMSHVLIRAYKLTQRDNVCLAGGTALNCLFNASITANTPFQECHISFAPDDSGNSIGAALELTYRKDGTIGHNVSTSALGPEFSDEEIGTTLESYKVRARQPESLLSEVADFLAEGKVVGWFQGRSEFGPRALGQRSILANPNTPGIKDKINRSVKHRESYRPFAPCIPLENERDYFTNMPDGGVPFMEKALTYRENVKKQISGCVHADGTGRVQTVTEEGQSSLFNLLKEFENRTGSPVLINTSFNLNNEPMVLTPVDAIRTFYSSGLDAMAIQGFLLEK